MKRTQSCEYRLFHNLCFQDLDKLYNKWLKPHKPQFNEVTCFFQCHSSYSFLVSTSTQSCPGDPRGPKARPLGTPSLVQTGRKISRNVVFPETSPEKCLIFKDVYVFCNVLLQNRWLGFPKKNGRSEGSMIFFEKHPAAEAQALKDGLNANR